MSNAPLQSLADAELAARRHDVWRGRLSSDYARVGEIAGEIAAGRLRTVRVGSRLRVRGADLARALAEGL